MAFEMPSIFYFSKLASQTEFRRSTVHIVDGIVSRCMLDAALNGKTQHGDFMQSYIGCAGSEFETVFNLQVAIESLAPGTQ